MSNFYIGQEVVCINDKGATSTLGDPSGLKKGKIYTINGLKYRECGCSGVLVDVGIRADIVATACQQCGNDSSTDRGVWWFLSIRFAPLQTASEELDMEESIKEALEKPAFA